MSGLATSERLRPTRPTYRDGLRRLVDAQAGHFLEAVEDQTHVRLRGARPLVDVRTLGAIMPQFQPHGFLRIHREYAVNLKKIREMRRRKQGQDWEVKLEPPVNRVLPVSRSGWPELEAALERSAEQKGRRSRKA